MPESMEAKLEAAEKRIAYLEEKIRLLENLKSALHAALMEASQLARTQGK